MFYEFRRVILQFIMCSSSDSHLSAQSPSCLLYMRGERPSSIQQQFASYRLYRTEMNVSTILLS
jgi:hypothetical protein